MDDGGRDIMVPAISYVYLFPLCYCALECNVGKGFATTESPISNTRNAIGENNGCKGGATIESMLSNTRNAIGGGVKHYSLGNDDIALVTFTLFNNLRGQVLLVKAVVDIVDDLFDHGGLVVVG